jgi:hypothetical protein
MERLFVRSLLQPGQPLHSGGKEALRKLPSTANPRPKHQPAPGGLDQFEVARMIALLDGYRSNHFDDFSRFEKIVKQGKLGRGFREEWDETKKNLLKLSGSVKAIPEVASWARAHTAFRASTVILIILGFAIVFTQTALFWLYVGSGIFYGGIFVFALAWFAGMKVTKNLQRYFERHPKEYKSAKEFLKERAQELIFALRDHMKRQGIESRRLDLFNVDYQGITKPKKSLLTRRYVASPTLN